MDNEKEGFDLSILVILGVIVFFIVIMAFVLSFTLATEYRTIEGDVIEVIPHTKNGELIYVEIIFEDGTIIETKQYKMYGGMTYDFVKGSTLIIEFSRSKNLKSDDYWYIESVYNVPENPGD